MDHRGVMARFCCNVEDGIRSFRHIVADRNYSLSSLDPKARNKTRQGLENCTSGPENAHELGADGIELHTQTFRRQGRKISDGYESYWRKYFDAVSQCPSATVWATRYHGALASFLISFRIGSVENICIIRSNEELLNLRPNNAMLFTFLQQAFVALSKRVDHFLIDQQLIDNSTDLNKLLPLPTIAGKSRDFPRRHCTDIAKADFCHHTFES